MRAPVITVQFKKYGVQLNFTPTLTASGAINLKVKPEVSSLDFTNAVTLQGFLIPAISSRVAETEVVLKEGESFAVAGLISTGYQLVTQRPASFRLLEQGPQPSTFAAVPFLVFAAPFIIMRNTIRGRRIEGRRAEIVMLATVIAGLWSLMSGTVVVLGLQVLLGV